MVGCAAELSRIDFSFVWARELEISGSYVYGSEKTVEQSPHTFEIALQLLNEHPDHPLPKMVTHTFPLDAVKDAMAASLSHGSSQAVKVVFDCRA
jgi:threonine dehydrogenase-like Zn-dependent dehydrogenase